MGRHNDLRSAFAGQLCELIRGRGDGWQRHERSVGRSLNRLPAGRAFDAPAPDKITGAVFGLEERGEGVRPELDGMPPIRVEQLQRLREKVEERGLATGWVE